MWANCDRDNVNNSQLFLLIISFINVGGVIYVGGQSLDGKLSNQILKLQSLRKEWRIMPQSLTVPQRSVIGVALKRSAVSSSLCHGK